MPDYQRNQWNRNRNYDLKHARWIQTDPLGVRVDAPRGMIDPPKQYTDGMNGYEYVANNPTSSVDTLGFESLGSSTLRQRIREAMTMIRMLRDKLLQAASAADKEAILARIRNLKFWTRYWSFIRGIDCVICCPTSVLDQAKSYLPTPAACYTPGYLESQTY